MQTEPDDRRRSGQSFIPCALVHSGSGPWTILLLKGDLAKQSLRSHFEGQPMQQREVEELRLQACVENGPKPVGAQADGDGGGSVTETLRDGTQVVAHSPDKVEDGKEDAGFQMVHRNDLPLYSAQTLVDFKGGTWNLILEFVCS